MDLSNDLISKFVKITNDGNKKETKEGTVYGTTVEYDGSMYVKIDGSDLLTPIDTTADIKEGERVTIMIKDHNATVTGNITSPSASSTDVKKVTKNVEEIEGEITEFEAIVADVVHVGELDAEVARIDELIAGKATIDDLTATNATIENLKAKDAEIENLVAKKATIDDLTATNAEITNLKAKDAEIENLVAKKATIDDLTATNATIENLSSVYANIDFANIGELAVEKLFAESGIIGDLTMKDGAVTGTLVGVKITGDLIEGNTIVAEKLVIKGNDGLFYKLNTDGMTVSAEQTNYNSLNGTIITAKSVTAEKINVSDLVAFDATIGGFKIGTDKIYSGVKSSINNTTRGIYLDNTGQIAFGDANNYIKYYKTSDGSYSLKISALDNIMLNSAHIDLHGYVTANGGFSIDTNGNITATNATITGNITATSGKIAGYTISGNKLVGSKVGMSGISGDGWAFWAGSDAPDSAPFKVGHNGSLTATKATITGNITATSGKIAGYTISGNQLVGSKVGMSGISGDGWAFWAGSDAPDSAPFKVGHNGSLTATDANISGTVNATSGTFSGEITGATITGGTIDIGGNFSINSAGTLTTNRQIYAQGGIYTYQDIRGLDDTHKTGGLTLVSGTGHVAVRTEAPAHSVYIQPASGEAYVTYPASSDLADLRLQNLFSEQTNANLGNFGSAQLYSTNAYLEFMYGLGVVRVAEANHLYLQCGSSAGNTSTEVRCTCYKNPNTYTNIRAYNVCAQNAVYANGVNVSSDRDRKRDIELYSTDALHEVCTTPVYTYHLDTDKDEELKRIGIIMQEAPLDAIDLSGKGVDLYQMVTMLWKATQQQQEMIEELKEQLKGE